MIDPSDTAKEWALARTDLLFLPIGACEQHGPHLPINTDALSADYFARILAEHFGGALLPPQAIASSLEHTGWRGSFSLRPETLMSLIRDIAEDAEAQNFRVLVLVNAHGGNFPLGPVCRDWNRRGRKLKLLLVEPFAFQKSIRTDRMDIHAGENETSVMMHITGRAFPLPEPVITGNMTSLRQSDLNTFGIGTLNPNGLPGHPEDASAEKGRILVGEMVEGMIRDVEERLAFLEKNPRYSGAGALYMRPCIEDDLPELTALSAEAGWNQTDGEWRQFLRFGRVWSMVHLNRIVGTAAWIPRGKDSVWIGLVVTKLEWRGFHIATRLLEQVLSDTSGYATRFLDASPPGIPIYRKLGFQDMVKVHRMILNVPAPAAPADASLTWRTIDPERDTLPGMADDDLLPAALIRREPSMAGSAERDGKTVAWFAGRHGRQYTHIAPLWAESPEAATEALRQALIRANGPYIIDVSEKQTDFLRFLTSLGFVATREFLRMRLGPDQEAHSSPRLFAAAGPEFG